MRLMSHVVLLLAGVSFAQVRMPEGELPRLPSDGGVFSQRLSASFPIIAVATTPTDAGTRHELVWGAQLPRVDSLYQATTLTFFSLAGGGLVRLFDSKGGVAAKSSQVLRFTWPRPLESWSLTDLGLADGPGTRRFVLREYLGSGCPGRETVHWLELRGGRISELLTTSTNGEGAEESLYLEGTTALWPAVDGGASDVPFLRSPLRFGPITDVAPSRRVIVFDANIEQGQVCRASRTLYRYADGGLEQVRVEQLDAGSPEVCRH